MSALVIAVLLSLAFFVNLDRAPRIVVLHTEKTKIVVKVPNKWEVVPIGSESDVVSTLVILRFNAHSGLFSSGLIPRNAAEITVSVMRGKGVKDLWAEDSLGSESVVPATKILKCKGVRARRQPVDIHKWSPGPNGEAYVDTIAYFPIKEGIVRVVLHMWERNHLPNHVHTDFEDVLCSIVVSLVGRSRHE